MNPLRLSYEMFVKFVYSPEEGTFPNDKVRNGLRVYVGDRSTYFEYGVFSNILTVGSYYKTAKAIGQAIGEIEKVIAGQKDEHYMDWETGDEYLIVKQEKTIVVCERKPIPDQYKYVSNDYVLQLMKDRKSFIEKNESMVYVEKEKVQDELL